MTTSSNWRAEAPDLIRTELEKRLPSECKIIDVEPDSFFHEGEEIRYVTVHFKGLHPCEDSRRINKIELDIRHLLRERGFDPVPGIEFLREGGSLA